MAASKLILGVTGSIAAYKALELLRLLQDEGYDVWVVMTEHAQKFVSALSFESLTHHPVFTRLFYEHEIYPVHIELTKDLQVLLVAPATANIIAKVRAGIADDLLSTLILSTTAPVIFVPAMNTNMWGSKITQRNIAELKSLGYHFIEPEEGRLACEAIGKGRFPEPKRIVEELRRILYPSSVLQAQKVVITAGRTEAHLDPVRVITNRATGKMGLELARAFYDAGANVTLILGGRLIVPDLPYKVISVSTNDELIKVLEEELKDAKLLIMNCAVCDYEVKEKGHSKIKDPVINVTLIKTQDILKMVRQAYPGLYIVGFSLDTEDHLKSGKKKLEEKGADLVVVNPQETIGSDEIRATIITATGDEISFPKLSKRAFSQKLVTFIESKLKGQTS
jgi:phosphopantothenoylcysteine decarboxylase/phosphopantothenate--cysteine ligase